MKTSSIEQPRPCFQCSNSDLNDDDLLEFSCNHKICIECFCNISISTGLREIHSKKTLTLTCPCASGQLEIPLQFLIDKVTLLDPNLNQRKCTRHNLTFNSYCMDCDLWLCPDCRSLFHDDYFKGHNLLAAKPKDHIHCKYHDTQETNLFCLDCCVEICELCSFNNGLHYEHKVIKLEEYINEFIKQKDKMVYNTYNKFEKVIDEKQKELINDVNEHIQNINNRFDDVIERINELRNDYIDKMNTELTTSQDMFKLVLLIFKYFYNEIENKPNPQIIKFYKELHSKITETKVFSNNINDILDNINTLIDNITDTSSPPNIDAFSYKIHFTNDNAISNQTLHGHKSTVMSLIELKDHRLISGGGPGDNSLKLWDINEMKCKHTLKGFSWGLLAVIQLKDGRICTGSGDNCISLWEYDSFVHVGDIFCHSDHIRALYQLSDESKVLSCGDDTMIKVSDIKEMKCVATLSGHTKPVTRAIQLKNGRIISCSKDMTIRVWDLKTQKGIAVLKGHTGAVNYVTELANGTVASCSDDKSLRIWNLTNGVCVGNYIKHTASVFQVIQIKDGRLATCSKDCTMNFWSLSKKNNLVTTVSGHRDGVRSIIQLSNGNIVTGSRDQNIKIWDISSI